MNFIKCSLKDPFIVNKYGIPEPTKGKIVYPDILSQLPISDRQIPDFSNIGIFLSPQNEINEDINPIQAGLSWALDKNRLQDHNLNGSEILSKELSSIPSVKKIGLSPINKIMLRNQMTIHNNNKEEIGFITSGCYSPILKKSIAIGYINKLSNISEKKYVNVRDQYEEIKLEKIPFVKKNYKKGD